MTIIFKTMGFTPDERKKRAAEDRVPCRTCAELAAEFGVTTKVLQTKLIMSKDAPKARLVHGGNASQHRRAYYGYAEVKAWWEKQK